MNPGTLYVVATPIGNLDDISHRAAQVLGRVDLVAAEDTRRTRKLLHHLGLTTDMVSYHDHNETVRSAELIRELEAGRSIALVSDGGTPCVSDPGYRLISAAHDAGIPVTGIPGPCAAVTALSVSGLPSERFVFEGFLPRKQGQRRQRWAVLAEESRAIVLYEAPHRIIPFLDELAEHLPHRRICICRELTKIHETLYRGLPGHVIAAFAEGSIKGELVIVVEAGMPMDDPEQRSFDEAVADIDMTRTSVRDAARRIAEMTGMKYREVYRRILEQRRVED